MAKRDINRWVFHIPLEDIQENYKDKGHDQECICCGKGVSIIKHVVHVVGSDIVSTDQPFSPDEDLGFHPIGESCKLNLPNNFYFKKYLKDEFI